MKEFVPTALVPLVGSAQYLRRRLSGRANHLQTRVFALSLLWFGLTEIGRGVYRPFVYAHGLDDFGVADTLGNSFGTLTAIFSVLVLAGQGTRRDLALIPLATLGLIVYELIDTFSGAPVDAADLAATLCFGVLAAVAYLLLLRIHGPSIGAAERRDPTLPE